jgi:hypothetical protein
MRTSDGEGEMATILERNQVRLCVVNDIELDNKLRLAPGDYTGKVTQIGFYKRSTKTLTQGDEIQAVWQPKKYFVLLSPEQSESIGRKIPANGGALSLYEVTEHVEAGLIETDCGSD